jgi:asparagine synthase (glutamine-hydrolysing)
VSAIVAIATADDRPPSIDIARRLLDRQSARGTAFRETHDAPHVALAIGRHEWEREPGLAGATGIGMRGRVVAVADASLYYRGDLRARLEAGGVHAASDEPVDLILAAYERWGPSCIEWLEGDFAFVLWDATRRRLLMARDYVGRRPLHYALIPEGIVVASTASAVAAHPACSRELDHGLIAGSMAGLLGGSDRSAYRAVRPVPVRTALTWTEARGLRVAAQWDPPTFSLGGRASGDDAAAELRELIARAVVERVPANGPAVVWLSGGADSTSVFAGGQDALARQGAPPLRAVSLSYPEGDSARENPWITAVAERWDTRVEWLDSETIPLLDGVAERAARRDDPYAHTFEACNRALSATSRSLGARVVFDGFGGDSLFHVSDAFLADLFVFGRWRWLAKEWRLREGGDGRDFFRACVRPMLPAPLFALATAIRDGTPLHDPRRQRIPEWIPATAVAQLNLDGMTRREPARRWHEGAAAYESRWYVTAPYMPRALTWASGFALEEGIEVRSPLVDRRILEFAASRPLSERNSGGESKWLLREAMRGLIPPAVLAPRESKTGVPQGYLRRQLLHGLKPVATVVFDGGRSRLADAGLLDVACLRNSLDRYAATGEHLLGVQLFLTLQAELWLRSHC